MTDEAIKAACIQAAATLVAAWWPAVRREDTPASQAQAELYLGGIRQAV